VIIRRARFHTPCMCVSWQDCELAELRLTVEKLTSPTSSQLPTSAAAVACSSSCPAANAAIPAATTGLSVSLSVCLSVSDVHCFYALYIVKMYQPLSNFVHSATISFTTVRCLLLVVQSLSVILCETSFHHSFRPASLHVSAVQWRVYNWQKVGMW